jgi:PAS domain S-box-containing protein
LIHPEDKSNFVEAVDNVMQGKSELEIDHRLRLSNGNEIFISSHGELIRDDRGIPNRMMGTMIDITKRKTAEETLKVSEEKYRTLFSSSPEAIILIDMDGMILDCNNAAANMAGLAKEQIVNRFFFDLGINDEKSLPKIMEMFQWIHETGEYNPLELQISIAGQERWIEVYQSLLKEKNEPYAVQLIINDITERKSAEEEIKKRNEELYTLNAISSTINQSLELKEVLSEALEETISVLKVEGGLIYLAEKSKESFSPAIYYGFSQEAIESISGFTMGEGISGQAAQLGVPLFVPNLAEDAKHISSAFLKDGWDSFVSVPLKSKEEIVGVMTVSSREKNKFKPEDIGLLRSIGNQIGVAIENARLYGISQDELAERRRVERKVSQQNKFLKSVLESLTNPFYVVNVNNNLIEVANSAARTKGLSVGSSCHDVIHGRDNIQEAAGYFCPIDDLIQTKEPKTVEHSFTDETGRLRYNEVHAYPIFDEKGNVDRVIEYAVDITGRKLAEAGLIEKDAQLRSIITSAPIVLWSLDKDGKFTLSEGKALEVLGLEPGQVVGQSVFDLYRDYPQVLEDNKRALAGEEFSSFLEMGDLVWDISFSPLKDKQGKVMGSIGVATDITKRRRAESEREILFRELKHRVKNNLQLLSSMVDMQILRTDDEAVKDKLQEIQGVIDTISLIYTRAYEGSHLIGLNLNNFIEEIVNASMKFRADDQLLITHTIIGDRIKLNTDQALPMALIANELIFNALKHAFSHRKRGKISVSLKRSNGEVTMSIADDGVGMDPHVDLRKPESFGLKIVKNLVEQLNGRIETLVDNGTEFIITIPMENGE